MDLQKTGQLIAALRREKKLTQKDIAEKLGISSKAVSKWETGRGFPDVCLVAGLSQIFGVDIVKLLNGEMPKKKTEAINVKRTKFYVCEACGNIVTSMSNAEVVCCGRTLSHLIPQEPDESHELRVDKVEEDFYITFSHPMTKEHYISFISYVRFDRILTVKLYPEQDGELRFPQMRGGCMYYYCNTHGLFELKI